jgi:DNA-binding XRE family transcriptional regulator
MTIQYLQIDRKKLALVDMKGAETLIEYLEDLEDSLEALRRTASESKTISQYNVKKEFLQNNICALRLKSGLSQKSLANRLKTTQAYISKIENPLYRPSLATLKKVASALNVEIEDLI